MRKDESKEVIGSLNRLGLDIIVKSCFYEFSNTKTMEEKRKIFGDTLLKVANETMRELNLDPKEIFLAEATLRPHLIESASELVNKNAETINTNHNINELVHQLCARGRIFEPLKDLHKKDVHELGRIFGLPETLVNGPLFSLPDMALRILCASEPYMDNDFAETQVGNLKIIICFLYLSGFVFYVLLSHFLHRLLLMQLWDSIQSHNLLMLRKQPHQLNRLH